MKIWRLLITATVLALAGLTVLSLQGAQGHFPPEGFGRVQGGLGPPPPGGRPYAGVPVVFSNGASTVTATTGATGRYEVVLPAGVWDIHTPDGKGCVIGLSVGSRSIQGASLIYPATGCLDLSGLPGTITPPSRVPVP